MIFNPIINPKDYYIGVGWLGANENVIDIIMGKRFIEYWGDDIIEVGAVVVHRGHEKKYLVIDPFHDYCKNVSDEYGQSVDAEYWNFEGENVLSISTIEHMGRIAYGETKKDYNKPIRFIEKLIKEANSFLISIPCPNHPSLPNENLNYYLMNSIYSMSWAGYIKIADDPQRWEWVWDLENYVRVLESKYGDPFKAVNGVIYIWKNLLI